MSPKLMPIVLIVLYLFTSAVYFYHGDIRRGVYWIAAAVLNACITF